MANRTSFEQQLAAVSKMARRTGDQALKDAVATLSVLCKADHALHLEEPDTDELTELLDRLLLGS